MPLPMPPAGRQCDDAVEQQISSILQAIGTPPDALTELKRHLKEGYQEYSAIRRVTAEPPDFSHVARLGEALSEVFSEDAGNI